jgi:hypothetical protein
MNERIRELAEQCYHRYSEHNIDLEKFAQLIVKECMSYLEEGDIDFAKFMIKKNFGVEE